MEETDQGESRQALAERILELVDRSGIGLDPEVSVSPGHFSREKVKLGPSMQDCAQALIKGGLTEKGGVHPGNLRINDRDGHPRDMRPDELAKGLGLLTMLGVQIEVHSTEPGLDVRPMESLYEAVGQKRPISEVAGRVMAGERS